MFRKWFRLGGGSGIRNASIHPLPMFLLMVDMHMYSN